MADHAHSDDPAVQAQLDRFAQLSPGRDILGLERIERLLALLDNPHLDLPPVFHVAGTNGKGSTCAYLRAILEAQGLVVHSATKPHLVRYNERIRVAGKLISDESLADLLKRVLDAAEDLGPSFFEVTTVATFLAFAETPADLALIEVGLGGKLELRLAHDLVRVDRGEGVVVALPRADAHGAIEQIRLEAQLVGGQRFRIERLRLDRKSVV